MVRMWVAVGILGILTTGFIRIRQAMSKLLDERDEVHRYIQAFGRYNTSNGADGEAYGELIDRSVRIQQVMGPLGIMRNYVAPFGRFVAAKYEIIMNGVPAMRHEMDRFAGGRDYRNLVGEALGRFIGWAEDRIQVKAREIRNPVIWFREGVAGLLLLPVWLLQSVGLLSPSGTARFAASPLFRYLTGLVSLLGFIATLIEITLGGENALDVWLRLWSRLT